MPAYLHDGILLYLDRLADWEQYYTLAQGEHSDVASEREALRGVLETTASLSPHGLLSHKTSTPKAERPGINRRNSSMARSWFRTQQSVPTRYCAKPVWSA